VEYAGDQVLACLGKLGKLSHVVLAVAMPPDAGSDRTQAMSGVALLIVEEKLLAGRLFEETGLTCSW
jgi:D-arabinose 5-phosphate isomerase GutQ